MNKVHHHHHQTLKGLLHVKKPAVVLLRNVFKVAKIFPLYENMSHEQVLQWNKSMKQKIIRYEQRKSSPLK